MNLNYFLAKDPTGGKIADVEKGEARVSNGSSHFQFQNIDLQCASSKGSVLSSAGKVFIEYISVMKLHKNKNYMK